MAFKDYAAELQRNLKSGHATEPTYYPALKSLLESLGPSLSVLQNPKKTEHGSPDFRVVRKKTIDFPVGWIEKMATSQRRSLPSPMLRPSSIICMHCCTRRTTGRDTRHFSEMSIRGFNSPQIRDSLQHCLKEVND